MLPGADRGYLNWDVAEHRERILRRELPSSRLWVFDEIHKYRHWRNYLKGVYDAHGAPPLGPRILFTGSARLEAYRFGGDSLQGRYHLLRLHPLSAAELGLKTPDELRDLPTPTVRRPRRPRREEGTEALPRQLVGGSCRGGALREPRRLPPAQVGPP